MVTIPDKPTISCGILDYPVAVVTTYKGGLVVITNVDVEFRSGKSLVSFLLPETIVKKNN